MKSLQPEVWINQTPLCYIIGYNILRYQALPWHISYQETVCFLGGGALYSAFSTYPTDHIRAMGISVQTLWVLVFRGVNDLPEGSFRRNDPSGEIVHTSKNQNPERLDRYSHGPDVFCGMWRKSREYGIQSSPPLEKSDVFLIADMPGKSLVSQYVISYDIT